MNKDKQRQLMKSLYCANKVIEATSKSFELHPMARLAYSWQLTEEATRVAQIPWQVFCTDSAEIDKRRSKRYHRKYIAKLKSQGARIISPAR